ncbi:MULTISPECIES: hypothetical protein [Winogradskyella]|jgi:hypothetical protein|uniref:hypothetical protein n=1 Tax=Winogradskyella TaxID=286104 RepID=UPI000C48B7C6|nr:hypothetical protein [Winogradskyella sp. MH6]MAB48210.1 hypothetical protein [Flavobacteriaceae bacterium]MBD09598.1 hypothetical protein [Flavobacteriaceae bacterium]|tara:strand:+ start:6728 stop:6913 length:186 start_codon:yes stop_codon:yes gene_type:complete
MDNKLLGNFIIAFPTAAYVTYIIVMKEPNSGIDWTSVIVGGLIGMISFTIGKKIKSKGEVE